jgi:hypothetical protein
VLDPAIDWVLRGALALLLATGAWAKAREGPAFRAAVEAYDLLPTRAVPAAAWLFTTAEGVLAIGLVAPVAAAGRAAALGAAALFALYATAIAIDLVRGRTDIDCGCGEAGAALPLSGWLVARNVALIVAALACAHGAAGRPLTGVDAVTIAGGIAVLAAVWRALHRLLATAAMLHRFQEDL